MRLFLHVLERSIIIFVHAFPEPYIYVHVHLCMNAYLCICIVHTCMYVYMMVPLISLEGQ